jgi:hypothetical protein
MKKKFALLLALIMVCATMLTACGGSSSKVIGTWELTSAMSEGIETVDQVKESGFDMSFEFKDDKAVLFLGGEKQGELDWEEDGDKITVSDGTTELVLTLTDGKLTMEESGATMVFEKK